jgi:large subunit ribosomal protein L29
MKPRKLRELTREELAQQYRDTQAELFNLCIRKGIQRVEQPSRIRLLRRDLARMLTIMREQDKSVM